MAIFHLSSQVFSRTAGHHAVQAAAYRAGARLRCDRTGLVFNYTRKREVTHRVILTPPNAAAWAIGRERLWNAVEVGETRVNSQLAREVEVALPIELNHAQHIQLIEGYCREQFVALGMVADIAIHSKPSNPHAHVMLTLRDIDQNGFGSKRRDWNAKDMLASWREAWADACNAALATAGHGARISHRSHRARGLSVLPTLHVGRRTPSNAGNHAERLEFNAWLRAHIELGRIRSEVQSIQSQLIDLTTSLSQALDERERARRLRQVVVTSVPGYGPRSSSASDRPAPAGQSRPVIALTPAQIQVAPLTAASLLRREVAASTPQGPASPWAPVTSSATSEHVAADIFKGEPTCWKP